LWRVETPMLLENACCGEERRRCLVHLWDAIVGAKEDPWWRNRLWLRVIAN
jgi:hypothetical protein